MAIRDTYTKVHEEWENLPNETTPVSAEALNHIEQGIKNAMDNRALREIYKDDRLNLGTNAGIGSITHGQGSYTPTNNSYAGGLGVIALSEAQHVQGKYNYPDAKYAHMVGGGTSNDDRKNIHTLDWNGNAMYAGTVESQGLILTDQATEQKYKLTIANGIIEITAVE